MLARVPQRCVPATCRMKSRAARIASLATGSTLRKNSTKCADTKFVDCLSNDRREAVDVVALAGELRCAPSRHGPCACQCLSKASACNIPSWLSKVNCANIVVPSRTLSTVDMKRVFGCIKMVVMDAVPERSTGSVGGYHFDLAREQSRLWSPELAF